VHVRRFPTAAQWRLLPTVFAPAEWRLVRLLATLAGLAATVALGTFLSDHLTLVARAGGSLTEVVVGSPQYVNPLLAHGNDADEALARLLYAGLTGRAADGTIVPVLASGYERSEDGKVYTVHLKEGVQWPDGEPFTTDDVLATVDFLQDSRYRLTAVSRLRGVAVERVDERTVRFTLTAPNASFPALLTFGLLPAHLWSNVEPSKFALVEYNLKPVGLGPFQFKELRRGRSGEVKSYTVERSRAWPGATPNLRRLTFRFVPDTGTAVKAITDRSAEAFATDEVREARDAPRGVLHRIPLTQYVAVFLNERNDVWKDAAVRRALAAATDREALVALPDVTGRTVDTPVLPGTPGALADRLFPAFDRAEAEKQLDEAGWKRPADGGVRAKGETKLAITLTTVDQPAYAAVADALKSNWEAVGASVTVERTDPTRFSKDSLKPRRYSTLLFAEQVGLDGDPYPFWHSSQERDPGLNLSTFFRKDIDEALERARAAADDPGRAAALGDFQRKFSEELPALILYQPSLIYVAPRRLGGVTATRAAGAADRFNGVTDWFVRRRLDWK
jgi:peptide/nickel transport system substrate-binding protein